MWSFVNLIVSLMVLNCACGQNSLQRDFNEAFTGRRADSNNAILEEP